MIHDGFSAGDKMRVSSPSSGLPVLQLNSSRIGVGLGLGRGIVGVVGVVGGEGEGRGASHIGGDSHRWGGSTTRGSKSPR